MTSPHPSVIHRLDLPSSIVHGGGSRRQTPDLVRHLGARSALLVTDPGVVALGFAEEIEKLLREADIQVTRFDSVQPDPTSDNVADGLAALQACHADCLIALGGGSPIDTAKVIAVRQANPQPLSEYMGLNKIARPGLPLIAIPTTAGTGSETTKVAVITDTERQVKMMMSSLPLLPTAAVVDYELSMGMPQALTAAVGIDTLTHGIEAYVSRKANAMTDPIALSCIRLVGMHLLTAWNEPDSRAARQGMMLAATQGGMAFANSSVCLVHGMSRPIGAVFHLPHGLSNAILLAAVTRFSIAAAPQRYADVARALGPDCAAPDHSDEQACDQLLRWIERACASLKLPRLSECPGATREVFEAEVERMAADALASGSPDNNPVIPTAEQIVALYREIW